MDGGYSTAFTAIYLTLQPKLAFGSSISHLRGRPQPHLNPGIYFLTGGNPFHAAGALVQ
jgi:hypothetical protein